VFFQSKVATKLQSVGMHQIADLLHHWQSKLQSHVIHVASLFRLPDHYAHHLAYVPTQLRLMTLAWSRLTTVVARIAKRPSLNLHA
jgi:hypothetical protein